MVLIHDQSYATISTPPQDEYTEDGINPDGILDSPAIERKIWQDTSETPGSITRSKRSKNPTSNGKGATTLTLRDQEKHIDNLKKENFNVKLRVHFLEERLAQLAPDQIDAALKQNINLKIEVQQRGMEIKKLKKLVLSLERELERLQQNTGPSNRNRERELEEILHEREIQLNELRSKSSHADDARNAELEEELESTKGLLEENMEEIDRLREIIERHGHDSSSDNINGDSRRELKKQLEEARAINEDLDAELDDRIGALNQREEEKLDLMDQLDDLRLKVEELERRRNAESFDRSESRAQILEEREEKEGLVENLNSMRDKYAALVIELQQREDEVEMRAKEIEELVTEHQRIVEVVEDEWKGEVEETRTQVEELRDVLAERETECKDLRMTVAELEANSTDLHSKYEAAFANLEEQIDQKDVDLENLQETIDKLGEQVYHLEDENEGLKEEHQRLREDEEAEKERSESLVAAFKEKTTSLKEELQQMSAMYETCSQEIHAHRSRQEELAQHVENLVEEVNRERAARERLNAEIDNAEKEYDAASRRDRRSLEAKEAELQSALNDLTRTRNLLSDRERDFEVVQSAQSAAQTLESKRIGETHTLVDKLHAENLDLSSQLAAQTQARLNISEKLDITLANLKNTETESTGLKSKVTDLEQRLSKDQRSLLSAENQYRDQLTERNTLLLTIYQYLDKILGVDKTPKSGGQAETKPFTNFSIFHDNLITRLKALSQIQMDFEKRCKEAEVKFTEKLTDMRKQLENRWKQIDKFESSLKTYAETKAGWKKKLVQRDGEVQALKSSNSDLATQLSSLKHPTTSDSFEIRSLTSRAQNAERRLNNAQNQLLSTEEKLAAVNQKTLLADNKWEARVKEFEARLKAAEERVKRERQGSKERVLELENVVKSLQRQLEIAQKRNVQLNDMVVGNNAGGSGTGPNPTR